MKRLEIILIAIFILSSCRTRSISLTQDIISTEFANFETFLNNKKISLDTMYLDKDNIKSIKISEQEKTVHIIQKKKNVKYFSPQTAFPAGQFRAIVINGELVENMKITKIEIGAIKSISTLREDIYKHPVGGTVLLITLK